MNTDFRKPRLRNLCNVPYAPHRKRFSLVHKVTQSACGAVRSVRCRGCGGAACGNQCSQTCGASAPWRVKCSRRTMTRTAEVQTILLLLLYRRIKRRQRRFWVREIFAQRRQRGSFSTLVQEMRLADSQSHFQYFRMSKEIFHNLLHKVS